MLSSLCLQQDNLFHVDVSMQLVINIDLYMYNTFSSGTLYTYYNVYTVIHIL